MRAVNLLPSKESSRERRRAPNFVALGGIVGAVALTALFAAWFLSSSGAVKDRQNEVDNLRAELSAIPAPAPSDDAGAEGLEQEKQARLTALATALGSRVAWDRVLSEISQVLPDDVWLGSLQASAPTAAAAAPGTTASGGFSITGTTYSHDSVARLLARLALVPHLQNVKLEKSTLNDGGGRVVVEFTIAATVRAAGASS